MNFDLLVNAEVAIHDWSGLREADGCASNIPEAFARLLASNSPAESTKAYWELENHVVVQGALFEASVATVSLIGAALVNCDRPKWVRIQLLELLFQIVSGESHSEESLRGLADLGPKCRVEAQKLLWILYGIFQHGEQWRAAREIIECIDPCSQRLRQLQIINRNAGRVDVEDRPKIR